MIAVIETKWYELFENLQLGEIIFCKFLELSLGLLKVIFRRKKQKNQGMSHRSFWNLDVAVLLKSKVLQLWR